MNIYKIMAKRMRQEEKEEEDWAELSFVLFTFGPEAADRLIDQRIRERHRCCAYVWSEIRARIFKRDDYTCSYCGARGGRLECDHVIPVSRGGSDRDDNLVTSCMACNRSKRDLLVSEWRPELCQ